MKKKCLFIVCMFIGLCSTRLFCVTDTQLARQFNWAEKTYLKLKHGVPMEGARLNKEVQAKLRELDKQFSEYAAKRDKVYSNLLEKFKQAEKLKEESLMFAEFKRIETNLRNQIQKLKREKGEGYKVAFLKWAKKNFLK